MKLLGRGYFACCRKWRTWGEGKGGWLSTWSIGQGSEFVIAIGQNLGLRREYLKSQKKQIETDRVSESKLDLQKYN
jgi:hypothetical protein